MADQCFTNESELETDAIHFCVEPSRRYISLAEVDSGGLHIMLNVEQARQLREWLDKVIP